MRRPSKKKYQDLLEVATELFLEHGYQQVSIVKLLQKAGGSRETVYRHFKNKEDLFAAVLDKQMQDYLKIMASLQVDVDDLRQGLLELCKLTLRVVTTERYVQLRRLVVSEAAARPELGKLYFEHIFSAGRRGWEAFIRRQQAAGRLRAGDPAVLTDYLIGMLLYTLSLQRLLNVRKAVGPKQIQQLSERVVDDFIGAFCRTP